MKKYKGNCRVRWWSASHPFRASSFLLSHSTFTNIFGEGEIFKQSGYHNDASSIIGINLFSNSSPSHHSLYIGEKIKC